MIHRAETLFTLNTRSPISSSPLLVDANDDGWPEIFVGGARFHGLNWDGTNLPRWPKKARRPFASSAAFGDINGDGRGEVVIGCDDGGVYAYHVDGSAVQGWPYHTNRDVFSTPALADLDSDGALEVVVGSDDGTLYVLKGDGTPAWKRRLPGKPFISASPTIADLDGDGMPEIATGAWDHVLHIWPSNGGSRLDVLPEGGSVIWSSATAFHTEEEGVFLAWASDRVQVASGHGKMAAGWPRRTHSWTASSPAPVRFVPEETSLVVGSDGLYAWDLRGRSLPGWPVDFGAFVWGSPIAFDVDGDGLREVVVGAWDGAVHAIRRNGSEVGGFPLQTRGPIFSSPAAAPLPEGGGLLVIASWDGSIRGWKLPEASFAEADWPQFRGSPSRVGVFLGSVARGRGTIPSPPIRQGHPQIMGAHTESWFGGVRRVVIEGSDLSLSRRLAVHYEIPGEEGVHISPAVKSGDLFVALIQPLRMLKRLRYWIELEREDGTKQRWPPRGVESVFQFPPAFSRLFEAIQGWSPETAWGRSGRQNI